MSAPTVTSAAATLYNVARLVAVWPTAAPFCVRKLPVHSFQLVLSSEPLAWPNESENGSAMTERCTAVAWAGQMAAPGLDQSPTPPAAFTVLSATDRTSVPPAYRFSVVPTT